MTKLRDNFKEVELCSEGDTIPASAAVSDPPTNLGVMPIKTDSEKMVAPSNNGYRIISSQEKFKIRPAIRMGVNVKSSVFEDQLSFVCKTFGFYVAPSTYLKSCLIIFLQRTLAFKGGS